MYLIRRNRGYQGYRVTPHDLRVGYGVGKPDLRVTHSKRYIKPTNINSDVLRTKFEPPDLRLFCRIKTMPSKDKPDLYKGQVHSW